MPASNDARDIHRGDIVLAASVALTAFVVYLRTLFPGLVVGGDSSAKFQYIGSVLGTPHAPGYPLYMLVWSCFAHLPIGSLAWRINAMSAFFSAATAFLSVLILVRLGVRRAVAAATALALAFGLAVWAYAVRAEVSALAGALIALLLFCAIQWQASRRERDLYLMVGVFALSLGNHLTVTTLVPGLLGFVLLTDRKAIRLRTVLVSALIVVAGLAQYGFIVLRTSRTLRTSRPGRRTCMSFSTSCVRPASLIRCLRSRRPSLLVDRIPRLWHVCVSEFNVLGILLLFVGLIAFIRDRAGVAVLIVFGAGGILFLTLNVDADVEGFLVPAFVLMWAIVGVGLEAVWSVAAGAPKQAAVVGLALALALPSLQVARNFGLTTITSVPTKSAISMRCSAASNSVPLS